MDNGPTGNFIIATDALFWGGSRTAPTCTEKRLQAAAQELDDEVTVTVTWIPPSVTVTLEVSVTWKEGGARGISGVRAVFEV